MKTPGTSAPTGCAPAGRQTRCEMRRRQTSYDACSGFAVGCGEPEGFTVGFGDDFPAVVAGTGVFGDGVLTVAEGTGVGVATTGFSGGGVAGAGVPGAGVLGAGVAGGVLGLVRSSHVKRSPAWPPISPSSFSQRSRQWARSGASNFSAVPGKTR